MGSGQAWAVTWHGGVGARWPTRHALMVSAVGLALGSDAPSLPTQCGQSETCSPPLLKHEAWAAPSCGQKPIPVSTAGWPGWRHREGQWGALAGVHGHWLASAGSPQALIKGRGGGVGGLCTALVSSPQARTHSCSSRPCRHCGPRESCGR